VSNYNRSHVSEKIILVGVAKKGQKRQIMRINISSALMEACHGAVERGIKGGQAGNMFDRQNGQHYARAAD
jgi:hypothetical protein